MNNTNEDAPFQMSQGYEILRPKHARAFPVTCDEWVNIKKRINELKFDGEYINDVGFLIWGVALSTLVSILLGAVIIEYRNTAWEIVVFAAITGIVCFVFNKRLGQEKKTHANDIISNMELIEKRFEEQIQYDEHTIGYLTKNQS